MMHEDTLLPFTFMINYPNFLYWMCRTGRFLLRSSQSMLSPATLVEYEEALNQGSMTAAEVFINLRSKSILHLFASIGRFLGLEVNVYTHLSTSFF